MTLARHLLIACSVSACCSSPDGVRSLVDHQAWTVLGPENDPFIASRPAEPQCEAASIGYEDFGGEPSFTVKSQGCTYLTIEQPATTACCSGEQVHVRLWHYELTNVDGASEAHAALAIAGRTLWEQATPIPSASELIRPYLPLEEDLEEGTPIQFHIRNHGSNTWNLIELSVGGEPSGE